MSFFVDVLLQGFAYSFLAMGVYISYKVLDFADLTVEGSFPLGAAITATCIVNGVNPFLSIIIAALGGAICGMVTGLLHVKLKISSLLSGILVMTAMYSVNLAVAGSANVGFFNETTIFSIASNLTESRDGIRWITVGIIFLLFVLFKLLLDWFMKTKLGFLLTITGDNPQLVSSLGIDIGKTKILGLSLSNALAAVSGAILCQNIRYFDINMSKGIVVIGLASVIIGMSVFKSVKFLKATSMVAIGAVIYRLAIATALKIGLAPENLNLIMVIIFISVLVFTDIDYKKYLPKLKKG